VSNELDILRRNVEACRQRIAKLAYSVNKNRGLFPLNITSVSLLNDDQEESIDALILRYAQSVSMIQDHIFRGIAYVEQEDLSDKSNRDKALLMEKLGAICSADEFGTAAMLRNKFSHHYSEDAEKRIEKLNLIVQEADFVINLFHGISAFLERKGYLVHYQ
jgi:hypothetical protein